MVEKRNDSEDLIITRIFDAPREVVWKAWTEPERVKKWWGPKGYIAPFVQSDFRVGGKFLYCMRSHEGQEYWSTGVYREIDPLKRIVSTDSFSDDKGNIVPASQYGMQGEWPLELLITVTFEDHNGKTKFTLRQKGLPAGEMFKLTTDGWNESLDKFESTLKL